MTSPDTKPKAEASAVEVLPSREDLARMLDPVAFGGPPRPTSSTGIAAMRVRQADAYQTADRLLNYFGHSRPAALQSSLSAEAELRAAHADELARYADYATEREDAGFARGEAVGRSDMQEVIVAALDRAASAEAERDIALTAITDARQVLADAGSEAMFLDDGVKALVLERDALRVENERLREALEPFSSFAIDAVDESGWSGREQNAHIHTWFGPTDFRRARSALDHGKGEER